MAFKLQPLPNICAKTDYYLVSKSDLDTQPNFVQHKLSGEILLLMANHLLSQHLVTLLFRNKIKAKVLVQDMRVLEFINQLCQFYATTEGQKLNPFSKQ